jgi:PAS domain S-box-containing protein
MIKSKVLIVEDETGTAEILKVTLENLGYEVTGQAASLDSFHQNIENNLPDVVLMDIYLQGKPDGIELAIEVHDKYKLPVIFVTGFADAKILEKAMATEPFGYLMKPVNSKELQSSIQMALHRHQAEKKIDHLNSVLKAIRAVSQLTVSAENATELIQKACEILISTRGYVNAWITLLDDGGNFSAFASSGLTGEFTRFYAEMKQGLWPDCIKCLENGIESYQLRHSKEDCGDCPLREAYPANDILTTRIRYKEKHLGYLTVTTPPSSLENHEEIDLFTEISEDLGLAISNLDRLKQKEEAEQEIIRARNDWEKTFDAIPDLIAIIDTDHRVVRANKAMLLKLKCSHDEATGCHCYELVHGMNEIPEFCPHARSLVSGKEENSEVFEHLLNGTYDVTTTPLFDDNGMLTSSVHIARDISSRKKKEQLMTETLAFSEFALNHPMNELLTLAIDKAELLTGSQIGFFHFLDEDEKAISLQVWSTNTRNQLCEAEGNSLHYPLEMAGVWVDCIRERRPVVHNDYESLPHKKGMPEGHPNIIRELTVPLFRGEKIVAILGVGNKPVDYDDEDLQIVTQLTNLAYEYIVTKRFEESLLKSEQYARALLGAIPDLIFRVDSNGVYLDYKGATDELYYQAAPIVGKNNRDLAPPDFADMIQEKINLTLEQRTMVLFEYQLPIPGMGLRDFEARMVPSGIDEVTAISRDITEHKKADETLRKKIEELEYFNHLMVDRELKMIDLKREINLLANRLGELDRYVIHHKNEIQ